MVHFLESVPLLRFLSFHSLYVFLTIIVYNYHSYHKILFANSNIWDLSLVTVFFLRICHIFLVLCMLSKFEFFLGYFKFYVMGTLDCVIFFWRVLISFSENKLHLLVSSSYHRSVVLSFSGVCSMHVRVWC